MSRHSTSRQYRPAAAIAVMIIMGVAWYVTALFAMRTLVFNPTDSAPTGLYVRVATVNLETPIGYSTPDYRRLVAFAVPTVAANWLARRYFPAQPPAGLLKPVFGLPGDEMCFRDGGYERNGERFSAALPATTEDGRRLPAWTGCEVLGAEEVFVFSARISNSFDSRSFGPVPIGALLGVYDPLWTW